MATTRTMVFKTTKKKMNGDKNEPGKKPKPQPKPTITTIGKSTVDKKNTDMILKRATDNIGRPHPITGKPMTKAQAMQMERQKEYKKNS
jgi:hypothetical protein